MGKTIASGLFIVRKDNKVLICHPTNHPADFYSIPKGKVEDDEIFLEAAIRETYEETNLDLSETTDFTIYPLTSVNYKIIRDMPDIIVMDVSFISLREILPHLVNELSNSKTQLVAMVKPQFEVYAEHGRSTSKDNSSTGSGFRSSHTSENLLNKGIVKNDAVRRQILKDFEDWSRQYFVIQNKRDSDVAGAKGNQERFYLLQPLKN